MRWALIFRERVLFEEVVSEAQFPKLDRMIRLVQVFWNPVAGRFES